MTAVRGDLQPTLFELSHAGRGGGKIPHPPADVLDRIRPPPGDEDTLALPELAPARLDGWVEAIGSWLFGCCCRHT